MKSNVVTLVGLFSLTTLVLYLTQRTPKIMAFM